MSLTPELRGAYLRRLGFPAGVEPSVAGLRSLHKGHLRRIPFENLDIHLGEPIVLDPEQLVRKLTERRRGGFCYELNGAFAALLEDLGFTVEQREARVVTPDGGLSMPFDHLCLRVGVEDEWFLVDVGFGACFDEPRPFVLDEDHEDPDGTFRLEARDEGWVELLQDGSPQYRFGPEHHDLADFTEAATWHQTSPESHFTQNPVCTRRTERGRVTLRGHRLIVTVGGEREERDLPTEELGAAYRDRFGIRLTSEEVARLA
jgi:N-hydroxyarylamine O-acetyltransferase